MTSRTNPVKWFEIPVRDMDRARQFYESVFGFQLSLNAMGPTLMAFFPFSQEGYGAGGALIKSEDFTPSHAGAMVYFAVADIEAILAGIQAHGGKMVTPRTDIGEHGFFAHFEDCEGNRVGLHASRAD